MLLVVLLADTSFLLQEDAASRCRHTAQGIKSCIKERREARRENNTLRRRPLPVQQYLLLLGSLLCIQLMCRVLQDCMGFLALMTI